MALKFKDTVKAGTRMEQDIVGVVSKYTSSIHRNVRIPTLFTQSGETEVDLIISLADTIIVIESKNISSIVGGVLDNYWTLVGYSAGQPYSSMNILTQNRIHVRSLKDLWFKNRGEFPLILSLVVVPNECIVPKELWESGVITLKELDSQLSSLSHEIKSDVYQYALDYLIRNLAGA